MTPGLYPGLSRAEYDSIDAINVSRLQHFERTPAHALEAIEHPKPPTDEMRFGTALHVAVLEPYRFPEAYVVAPTFDLRRKGAKEAKAEFEAKHEGANFIDTDEMATLKGMQTSIWSRPEVAELLDSPGGHNEVGVVWIDEETGILCKGLIDRIGPYDGWTWIQDLKSTKDAGRRSFCGDIKKLHYGAKAAWYLDGCNTVAPYERRFAWIAAEKAPPFAVKVYEADFTALDAGRAKYRRWLRNYAEAKATNEWPDYPAGIEPLGASETEYR